MSCTIIPIKYGDFSFEGVPLKSTASVTPMKADDGFTIKYYKVFIQVEFIYAVPEDFTDFFGINSTDDFIDYAKSILLTRGLPLTYNYRGFGKLISTVGESELGVDATFGPHPKIVEWEPIGGNKAVKIVWQVEFTQLVCPVFIRDKKELSRQSFKILSLVEDTNLSYDEDGSVVVTTNGTLEIAAGSTVLRRDSLKKFLTLFFPNQIQYFQRKINISLRKDQRTVDYNITDTEIKSDNAYFPYMVRQDVSHEMSSNLLSKNVFEGSGFQSWSNTLNGSFEVRPGVWKGWAWVAFAIILANRRNRSSSDFSLLQQHVKDENDAPEGDDPDNARKERKKSDPFQFPIALNIKEDIYGRSVDISSKWVTVCSLFDLFKQTGMFYPVHSKWKQNGYPSMPPDEFWKKEEELNSVQWGLWKDQISALTDGDGYRTLTLPNFELIFDPCTSYPMQQYVGSERQAFYYRSVNFEPSLLPDLTYPERDTIPLGKASYDIRADKSTSAQYLKKLTPSISFIAYHNTFDIFEVTNAAYIPSLEYRDPSTLTAGTQELANTRKDKTGFRINGQTSTSFNSDWDNEIVQIRGKPIYKVRMRGYAIRIGYQIPAPVLTGVLVSNGGGSVSEATAYRIGDQKWSHRLLNRSEEVPLFLAKWEQHYAIPQNVASDNLKFSSSGLPAEFS